MDRTTYPPRYKRSHISTVVKAYGDNYIVDVGDTIGNMLLKYWPNNWERVADRGSSQFNSVSGRVITHKLGHTNYQVHILPTQDPAGYLGEVWSEKSNNQIIVYNSGSAQTSFEYKIEPLS